MIDISCVLDSIEVEKKRRNDGLIQQDPHALVLWDQALDAIDSVMEKDSLKKAFIFAKSLEYKHVGLSSEIYFTHPIRVSALSILLSGKTKSSVGILGLLHNVLEVSNLTENSISKKFGLEIATNISTLTVDRDKQWDGKYKVDYYNKIINSHQSCRIVKIIDKLDNLFLLENNKDSSIKKMYLDEIDKFILPMVQVDLPHLNGYMKELICGLRQSELKKH
jgi:(p)ppGpp synthase/HD superfamily hydrolase